MTHVSSELDKILQANIQDEATYRKVKQMIEAERAPMEEQTRYLKQLHHLATRHYASLEEMFMAYLEVGCDVLDLPSGIVSFVDATIYHIEASYPDTSQAKKQLKLDDVLCKKTVEDNKTRTFVNMNSMSPSPKSSSPDYANLENYMGTPIRLNGSVWGTICFFGDDKRDQSFSELDIEFIELMAQGISNALDSASKQQLQELAENRYRLMFENINTPVILYDVETYNIIDVNQSAIDFYGYSYEEFVEINEFELNMLPERDIKNRILENRAAGRAYVRFPHRLKSGEIREVEAYMSDLDMNGRLVRFAVIYDYLERYEAEEALKHSEANLRAIFDTATQFMFLIDDTSKIIAMNRSARQLIDNINDTQPSRDLTIANNHGMDANRYLVTEYLNLAFQGKTISHETYLKLPKQDNQLIYIDYRYVPVKTSDDQVIGVCVTGQDITKLKTSQEELAHERNILRSLIDNLPDSIYIKDMNARILAANQQYVETTNATTVDQVIGKNAMELFPDHGHNAYQDDVSVLAGNKILDKHEPILRDGKQIGTYETSKIPIYNEHNHVVGLVGVKRDITKQLEAETALYRRDAILKTISVAAQQFLTHPDWREGIESILEQLGTAIEIDRVYVYQNSEAHTESVSGSKPLYEWARPGIKSYHSYENKTGIKWQQLRWLRSFVRGEMIFGNTSDMEPTEADAMRDYDIQSVAMMPVMVGSYWWGVIGFDSVSSPRIWHPAKLDALMTAASTLGAAIEREQMEQGIRENEEKFNQLITHIPEAFWIYDIQSRDIVYASEKYEDMFGVSVQARQKDINLFLEQVHPEDRHLVQKNLERQSHGESSEYEARFINDDDTYRWVNIRIYPIRNIDGEIYRVAGVASNITERKQSEQDKLEMMAQSERIAILSQFIRDATHEFKTPLSIINTRLYVLERTDEKEKQLENLKIIHDQVEGISDLIESLVLMSRLDGRTDITLNTVNINTIVRQLNMSLRDNYPHRADDFRMLLDEDVPPIIGNLIFITKAVRNLVDNAVRYSSDKTPILLQTAQDTRHVMIKIQDKGVGIAKEEQKQIFKRFYRQDSAHSTRGFGLGLPIAQRIAQRHGGDIKVKSIVGEGSAFYILLPKLKIDE